MNSDKNSFLGDIFGGITNPETSANFAKEHAVQYSITKQMSKTGRDAWNALVPGTIDLAVGVPIRAISAVARTAANTTLGVGWTATHTAATAAEKSVVGLSDTLRIKGDSGSLAV